MVVLVLFAAALICRPCSAKEGYGPPPGTAGPNRSDPVDGPSGYQGPFIGQPGMEVIPSRAEDNHRFVSPSRVFPRGAADTPISRVASDPPGTRRNAGELRVDLELREAVKTPYDYPKQGQARSASGALRGMVRA